MTLDMYKNGKEALVVPQGTDMADFFEKHPSLKAKFQHVPAQQIDSAEPRIGGKSEQETLADIDNHGYSHWTAEITMTECTGK